MIVKSAKFIASYVKLEDIPLTDLPEYAFIGRSNVGKSSLINLLTGYNTLAKVSQTPGKTQLLNFFLVNVTWHLMDLPGYGYAKVSQTSRKQWHAMIRRYLTGRENLACVFLLIDSRIPPQKIDIEFTTWLGEKEIPFVIVFTKADKISSPEIVKNMEAFKEKLLETFFALPDIFVTSASKKRGGEEILKFIDEVNGRWEQEL